MTGVEVRILGAFEVLFNGHPCPVAGTAERELLARLALSPAHVVSADRLIDDVWGERLPVDAANALQSRVSKVRRALSRAGADSAVLSTERPGYVLRVPADAVDSHRFTRLAAEARRAKDRQAFAVAAVAYDEALALWRGPALTDFTATWAVNEAARLEELRLVAIEERNDVLLAMGQHSELVAELEAQVTAQPLRERMRAQLMLALYRSGRQADALAVFADARERLAEELGIDPGQELQQLEGALLRQDPALDAPARAPVRARIVLPVRRTSFLGRDQLVDAVARLLDAHSMVTLTGPGGAGKTTLAIEVARLLRARFSDGGAFVALSGVSQPQQVAQAVAEAFGIPLEASLDRLFSALSTRHALVVLDNCEHVAETAAELAERLLAHCPDLTILATSREPLRVDGETQLAVPPLPVPAESAGLETLVDNPSVALFRDRAQAVDATFAIDPGNAAAVARICTALDGMPLAIELAAARVRVLSPADIADRLDDRFALLSGGGRRGEARQQTLRATVDWSHDLLTANEQRLFRRLSVFRGGWTMDAAEDVCSGDGLDQRDVLDLLSRLVDRSLVVADTANRRFRMLETLRHYASERLAGCGEEAVVRDRHVRYFLDLAERAEVQLRGPQQSAWLERLRVERDNLHHALSWCAAEPAGRGEAGLRLVGALGWWWYLGRHDEGRDWVDRMLGATGQDGDARARAHRAASLVWRPGACVVHPSPRCAQEAAAALDSAGNADSTVAAYARTLLAVEAVATADLTEADTLLDRALQTFSSAGDDWGAALVRFVRSEIAFHRATLPPHDALRLSEEAATEFANLGDQWGLSAVLAHQAHALERAGRYEQALAVSERVVEISRRLDLQITLQWMLAEVGYLHLLLGRVDVAEPFFSEALAFAAAAGGGPGVPTSRLGMGAAARVRGDHEAALRHFEAAAATAHAQGMSTIHHLALAEMGHAALDAGDVEAARRHLRRALDSAEEFDDSAAIARALEGLAVVEARAGDARDAARLLGAAAAVRERHGWPANPIQARDVDQASAAARALLTDAEFTAAFAAGRDDSAADPARSFTA